MECNLPQSETKNEELKPQKTHSKRLRSKYSGKKRIRQSN